MLEEVINKTNIRDVFIILIASLAIVGIWRGVWNLMDEYLIPQNFIYSQITSIFFGLIILFIIGMIKLKKSGKIKAIKIS